MKLFIKTSLFFILLFAFWMPAFSLTHRLNPSPSLTPKVLSNFRMKEKILNSQNTTSSNEELVYSFKGIFVKMQNTFGFFLNA